MKLIDQLDRGYPAPARGQIEVQRLMKDIQKKSDGRSTRSRKPRRKKVVAEGRVASTLAPMFHKGGYMDTLTYDQMMETYGFIPFNHQKPNFFPVGTQPIFDHTGKAIPGHEAVMRGDTGDVLAVHSDKYSMVPYEEHFQIFEEAIEVSNLNSTNMRIATDFQDNGAKIFRQYLFPEHTMMLDTSVRDEADRAAHLHVRQLRRHDRLAGQGGLLRLRLRQCRHLRHRDRQLPLQACRRHEGEGLPGG